MLSVDWRRWFRTTLFSNQRTKRTLYRQPIRDRFKPEGLQLEDRLVPANFTPTTFVDVPISSIGVVDNLGQITDQGNAISLRSAVIAANNAGGLNSILLDSGIYTLSIVGDADDRDFVGFDPLIGDLNANDSGLTIQGNGPANTTILQTTGADRILTDNANADPGFQFTVTGITFSDGRDGSASIGGGALFLGSMGGTSSITDCVFVDNQTTGGALGGAIRNVGGDLIVTDCTFGGVGANDANVSTSGGGAIAFDASDFVNPAGAGTLTVTGSTFINNSAASTSSGGGALRIDGSNGSAAVADIIASTFIGNTNTTGDGGAISINGGTLSVATSTFDSNQAQGAGRGGAIRSSSGADASVIFSRFVNNAAADGNVLDFAADGGSFTANDNWWASNLGPLASDIGSGAGSAAITVANFLELNITAIPTSLIAGGASVLSADFLTDSAANPIDPSNLTALIGLPINFSATLGGISGADATIQATGSAAAAYSAGATAGIGSATATVDGVVATAAITITSTVSLNTNSLPANAVSITINGAGFSAIAANNTVAFNNGATGNVTAATADSLTVTFTTRPSAGALTAVVTSSGVDSGVAVQVATVIPVITPNATSLAVTATTLLINGFGFDATPGNNIVAFSSGVTGTVTTATPTQLTVTGMTGLGVGVLTASITVNGFSNGAAVQVATVAPVVTASAANLAATATSIVINGFGFAPALGSNSVSFSGGVTGVVTGATATQLTISGLSGLVGGAFSVSVTSSGVSSGTPVQVATVSPVVTANTAQIANATLFIISGFGFSITPANNTVVFNLGAVGTVTAATPTLLLVTFDTLPAVGALTAVVISNGVSNGAVVQVATVVTFSLSALPDWTINQTFLPVVTATGGTGPFGFSVTDGALPTGLTLNADGSFTGAPTVGGSFTFTITATQSAFATVQRIYTLNINDQPTINNLVTTAWTRNAPGFLGTLIISNGTGPYTPVSASGIPPGLTPFLIGSSISFAGTPTTIGTFNGAVSIIDSAGATAVKNFTIVINAEIKFKLAALPTYVALKAYKQNISGVTGGAGPITVTYQLSGPLPPGMTFNPVTGLLSGKPKNAKITVRITATATDAAGSIAVKVYTLSAKRLARGL